MASSGRLLAFLLLLGVAISACMAGAGSVNVHVDTSKAVGRVSEYFRGFTCDWWRHNNPSYGDDWRMAGMLTLDLTSSRLKKMFQNLVPALWRIGGTPEDEVVYAIGNPPECPPDQIQNSTNYPGPLCLTAQRFKDIVTFAQETGVHLAFGLNGAYGRKDRNSNFNSTNAFQLLQFAASTKLPIFAFELSNEKNGWNATKLGEDFLVIRTYINALWPDESTRPILVGPDTGAMSWIQDFLEVAKPGLNATTYHAYCNGYATCKSTMLDPKELNHCIDPALLAIKYTRAAIPEQPDFPVWAGEDGPHSGGGRPACSDRFADVYWYLDHLATLGLHSVQAFARSTMVGANYGLLNRTTFEPHPDYYAAYLWGKVMGRSHMAVISDNAMLRAYSTCVNQSAVAILLLNLDTTDSLMVTMTTGNDARPEAVATDTAAAGGQQAVYVMRAPGGSVDGMYADGVEFLTEKGEYELLKLGDDDELPSLVPTMQASGGLTLGPLSYAFVLLDQAAGTCKV